MTWRRRAWPNGYGSGPAPDVTCVDASHCAMIGFVEHNAKVVSPVSVTPRGKTPCSTRVTFAAPATVPGGMQGDSFMDIGQIQCPQPDACIGIGDSDKGSTATPIYTNHG
jgi:hypothetical protein